ncbi:MAG TPA: hypothetical protein VNX46_07610 [Candidatus Acidoferrum sp.]|jgi:hypothetical protein|nr:hypothetical protein [Candidatus Acidoferrum sp.]
MKHYEQYPMMQPYVGKHFGRLGAPALLLIGESHYLPEGATQHLSADRWYSGSSTTLSPDEVEWISTAAVFDDARERRFPNKGHIIWSNALWEINEHGPRYTDYTYVADDVAFYNFFLRPGLEGESLAVETEDVQLANETFDIHFESLKPTAVVFLSSLARYHFQLPAICSVPIISTPHPGCQWWNRVALKYGNRRGRDILADFVRTLNWSQNALPA